LATRTATTAPPRTGAIIAATKLRVPPRRLALVPRDALVALVAGSPHTRLTLLSAPAGSGKTTLLTLWYISATEDRPFAWLSLDAADNDPVRFWSGVIAALRTIVPGAGEAAEAALLSPGSDLVAVVVPLLVNDLAGRDAPSVLVLDDLHEVVDARVHASLSALLDLAPATLQLAIATRSDPDLPLNRLRARDQMVELRGGHLRFSDAEAAAFLNGGLGLDLSSEEVTQIQRRTEGWAAGLQLAGLTLRGRTERAAFLASFAGDDRHIVDYLSGEVLDGITPKLRGFLVRTSILDRLCPDLCDVVTGESGSAERLAELERRNLFTVALDDRRWWYRYHPLFAELLRRELQRHAAASVPGLHRRAAAWWAGQGAVAEAVGHAIAGDDLATATELVAVHWSEFFNRGWLTTVAGWLRALRPEALESDTRLWLAHAWTALDVGALEEVESWLEPVPGATDERRAWADVLRALHRFKAGDVARAAADAHRAAQAVGAQPPFLRTVAALASAIAAYWNGDIQIARGAFDEGARLAGEDGNALAVNYALGYLGLDAAQRGLVTEAAAHLARADQLVAREPPLDEHFTGMMRHFARGRLDEREGRLDRADAELARAGELSRRGAGVVEIGAVHVAHARVLAARGEHAAAAQELRRAEAALEGRPDPGRIAGELDAARRALEPPPRAPARSGDALSESERRVLRLLAGDLPLRAIGDELYLSLNTIKTHTRNIYAKLGAASRDEAVGRARELGLI
jgi:LuxR family maltose regulon positive regulatory protein